MARFMVLNPKDNVAAAVVKIMSGDTLEIPGGGSFKALNEVPFAHKIAVKPIIEKAQEAVQKRAWQGSTGGRSGV